MSMNMMTVRQLKSGLSGLKIGLAKLQKGGWCQGVPRKWVDGRFHYCALGAVPSGKQTNACNVLVAGIKQTMSEMRLSAYSHEGVVAWNDTPGRTKQQVLKAYRAAIKLGTKQLEKGDAS